MTGKRRQKMQRISDVARAGGVGVETVRFYEREGFIEQPPKPLRGWREYGARQLAQLSAVKLGQELGLSLADMRALQSLARGEQASFCGAVRTTLAKRLAKIESEIAALEKKRSGLSGWLAQCVARGAARDCPLYAQMQSVVPPKRRKT